MTAFFSNPKPNWKCRIGLHWWNMTQGYDGKPHSRAVCVRCGKAYNKEASTGAHRT